MKKSLLSVFLLCLMCVAAVAGVSRRNPTTGVYEDVPLSTNVTFGDLTESGLTFLRDLGKGSNVGVLYGGTDGRVRPAVDGTDFVAPLGDYNKVIACIGSSVMAGLNTTGFSTGADGFPNGGSGYMQLLSSALTSQGFTIYNRAVSGNTTVDGTGRFIHDIIPLKPRYCMLGFSLWNEGIMGTDSHGNTITADNCITQFLANIHWMVLECRKAGIVPIVVSCYPNNNYTAQEYRYFLSVNSQLEAEGCLIVDADGPVDDGTGKFQTGYYADALHPNDTGHKAIFAAIPLSFFSTGIDYVYKPQRPHGGGVNYAASDGVTAPLLCAPVDGMVNFTIAAWVQKLDTGNTQAFLGFGPPGQNDRVNNAGGGFGTNFHITTQASHELTSDVYADDRQWHLIAAVHREQSQTTELWVDGVLKSSTNGETYGTTARLMNFCAAGKLQSGAVNSPNTNYQGVAVYRTSLNAYQMAQLASGIYPTMSLECYAPLTDQRFVDKDRLVNLAPTTSYFKVQGGTTMSPLVRKYIVPDQWVTYVTTLASVTNSASGYTTVPELQVNLIAGRVYRIKSFVRFDVGAGGIQIRVNFSGTVNWQGGFGRAGASSAAWNTLADNSSVLTTYSFTQAGAGTGGMEVDGTISVATTGLYTVQWQQNSSNAAASSIREGSYISVNQIY